MPQINERIRFTLPTGRRLTGVVDTVWGRSGQLDVIVGAVQYPVHIDQLLPAGRYPREVDNLIQAARKVLLGYDSLDIGETTPDGAAMIQRLSESYIALNQRARR